MWVFGLVWVGGCTVLWVGGLVEFVVGGLVLWFGLSRGLV